MIYLSTATPTKVILQSNKQTLPLIQGDILTNYYTFKITSCDSFKEYVFSPTNFSQSPYYDAFTVSVGSTVSATGSVMINAEPGQYNFSVYKMANQFDLNINNARYMTEQGILQITDPNGFNWEGGNGGISFTQSDADTIKVFTEL